MLFCGSRCHLDDHGVSPRRSCSAVAQTKNPRAFLSSGGGFECRIAKEWLAQAPPRTRDRLRPPIPVIVRAHRVAPLLVTVKFHNRDYRPMRPEEARVPAQSRRKLPSRFFPCSVSTLSGWNCTPSTGHSRWRRAMIRPSAEVAETSRQSGRVPVRR